jgi:hypothetical protein
MNESSRPSAMESHPILPDTQADRTVDKSGKVKTAGSLVDFFWGDASARAGFARIVLKVAFAIFIAFLIHELVLPFVLLRISKTDIDAVQTKIDSANEILKRAVIDKRFQEGLLSLCVDSIPGNAQGCATNRFDEHHGFAIQVIENAGANKKEEPREIFSVLFYKVDHALGLISAPRIEGSTDLLMREVERIAFNPKDVPITELKLCTGTAKLLSGANCTITTELRDTLSPASGGGLDGLVNSLRFGSLLIGLVQFGTWCIFVYAVVEIIGLKLRWVSPPDVLYSVSESEGGSKRVPADLKVALQEYASSPVQGIGDRMYRRMLAAGIGSSSSQKGEASNEELVSTLSSYREFLLDDAAARQESLETFGDTMLKLAFLGTVYGISVSLFSARGLDTADPIRRLASKGDMYAGIGLGFGTTFVGIVLSIIAAQFRTNLSAAWSGEIGAAYRLILDHGAEAIRRQASALSDKERDDLGRVRLPRRSTGLYPRRDGTKTEWTSLHYLGLLVALLILGALAYVFFPMIVSVLSSEN